MLKYQQTTLLWFCMQLRFVDNSVFYQRKTHPFLLYRSYSLINFAKKLNQIIHLKPINYGNVPDYHEES